MAYVDFAAVKRLIPVPALLTRRGWQPVSGYGVPLRGPCPIHLTTRPRSRSLAVTQAEWYCHRCKTGGDVIDLWIALHPAVFANSKEAAVDLCEEFGVNVPWVARRRGARNSEEERCGGSGGNAPRDEPHPYPIAPTENDHA